MRPATLASCRLPSITSMTWPTSSPLRRRRITRRPRGPAGCRRPDSPSRTRAPPGNPVRVGGTWFVGRRAGGLAGPGERRAGHAVPDRRAPTPTRPASSSSRDPTSGRSAGSSWASRSTAARCSTPGSTASSGWPVGWSWCDGETRLVRTGAIMRIPQLAIHLDREHERRGLKLDRQQHTAPVWSVGRPGVRILDHLAELVGGDGERHRRLRPDGLRHRGAVGVRGPSRSSSPRAGWTT